MQYFIITGEMFSNVQSHCASVLQKLTMHETSSLSQVQYMQRAFSPPYGELPSYEGTGYLLCPHWHLFLLILQDGEDLCQLPLCTVFVKVIATNCSSNCEFESYCYSYICSLFVNISHLVYPNSNCHLINVKVFWSLCGPFQRV